MAALASLVASAFAGAVASPADAKSKTKPPVITKVAPMNVAVGESLTIRGRHFLRGRDKNTVVFKRARARAVFVKAQYGTAKMLKVTIPTSLQAVFATKNNVPQPTRFQLRILTTKLGKKFTSKGRSPIVSGPRPPAPPASAASGDCDDDGIKNSVETDDDDDLLPDTLEAQINTDACNADTDGDGVGDGYEYKSALDLNDDEYQEPNSLVFYPVKKPYPNPLYAGDANTDFDGDSLTLAEEHDLWIYTWNVSHTDARTLTPLSYSDGEQYSRLERGADNRRKPTLRADGYDKHQQFVDWASRAGYRTVLLHNDTNWTHGLTGNPFGPSTFYGLFDMDRDGHESDDELKNYDFDTSGKGWLSDDERDEDADGLTNYDEAHGRMRPEYWQGCYPEMPFHVPYAGTKLDDADTDGDMILDGADDQDHDDIPNVMELSRFAASHLWDGDDPYVECRGSAATPNHQDAFGRVNPFNPCLPDVRSRTCPRIVDQKTGAPFDGSPDWLSLN
jgi:hypothetical protein